MNFTDENRKFWSAGWAQGQSTSLKYNGAFVTRKILMNAFGLGVNDTLPSSAPEITIEGVRVKIVPKLYVGSRATKPHRIIATCPDCGMEVSAGRMHQHLGTKICQMGRQQHEDEVANG